MSEPCESFDPFSPEEVVYLLPDKCRACNFGAFIVALESLDLRRQKPLERIQDIGKRCTGYEGPDTDSDMYSKGADRSGCPYAIMVREDKDREQTA